MTESRGKLLSVTPEGVCRWVDNTYEGIKDGLDDKFFCLAGINEDVSFYAEDEAILDRRPLNVPASMFSGRSLYGSVILISAEPDDEGNNLPPSDPGYVFMLQDMAKRWRSVIDGAERIGLDVMQPANPADLRPANIVAFDSFDELKQEMGWKD